MEMRQKALAQQCLDGAYDNTIGFAEGVQMLMDAGFDGYHVDYRLGTRTYYLPDGEALVLRDPHDHGAVARHFNESEIAAAIKWAQLNPLDYNYNDFNSKVIANGCAGYMVSFPGRRVLYFGRTAETHVEHFPR